MISMLFYMMCAVWAWLERLQINKYMHRMISTQKRKKKNPMHVKITNQVAK